jgi:NMD protein affecting ribosome stability and mRNA decay
MNDFDLESKLKSAPVPERTEEYWEDFPSRVRLQLCRERQEFTPQRTWRPRLAWAGGLALVVALVFVCVEFHPVQATAAAIASHEQHLRAHLARLDAGLHALVLNTDGMGYLLAEAN